MTNDVLPSLKHTQSLFPLLRDQFGRSITYLRLSVTDRCNLRCRYCLPEKDVSFQPRHEILSWKEMLRVTRIFTQLGIVKLRITGGEPFLRKGILDFLQQISRIPELKGFYLTTNGVEAAPFLAELKNMKIAGINLSLDTLRRDRYEMITRRDYLHRVIEVFYRILELGIPLKINTVVKKGFNTDEIEPLARLAEKNPIEVRFIEEMPQLSGGNQRDGDWHFAQIVTELKSHFPGITPFSPNEGTAKKYRIPGFSGKIGIIAGHSRLFCSTCNRIRLTAAGQLKTCLYDNSVLDLRRLLRSGAKDAEISRVIIGSVTSRAFDGFAAFDNGDGTKRHSMAAIGG